MTKHIPKKKTIRIAFAIDKNGIYHIYANDMEEDNSLLNEATAMVEDSDGIKPFNTGFIEVELPLPKALEIKGKVCVD